ncbi:hypothetical protein BDR03DRAFT_956215 [Suillus americanus]|nr:hypothetical protein BDR03DRAFT_956215 [Suillus americanus]
MWLLTLFEEAWYQRGGPFFFSTSFKALYFSSDGVVVGNLSAIGSFEAKAMHQNSVPLEVFTCRNLV